MKTAFLFSALITLLVGCTSVPKPSVDQKQKIEIKSMQNVKERVQWLRQKWSANEILLVFDIDNTVLTMPQGLGSDQWFIWQTKMLRNEQQNQGLVAKDFDKLLKIQYQLFLSAPMILTEPVIKDMIGEWKTEGHQVLALTSRGHPSAEVTLRELNRAGVEFSSEFSDKLPSGPFKVSDTVSEKAAFNRDVVFRSGVLFSAGQNKGKMLDYLLKKASPGISAVVFVDDHLTHVLDVHSAFKSKPVHLSAFRYGHEDLNVSRFNYGLGKSLARQQWTELAIACREKKANHVESLLRAIFGKESVSKEDLKICSLAD